jgi:rSAM/selenodomain-associated transferase 1
MVDAAHAPVLAILTRAPSAGGKTRLFASLGLPSDPALLTALLLDTLDGTVAVGVRRVIAVTPAEACDEVRRIAGDVDVMPQPDGDLGERMRGVMAALFAQGAPVVALIGSDLPEITPDAVAEACAVAAEDRDAVVLGPAADGGYSLIAAQRVPDVFSNVTWGSSAVLAQTERAAAKAGLRIRYLRELTDVDTADDLRRASRSGRARRTARWFHARA